MSSLKAWLQGAARSCKSWKHLLWEKHCSTVRTGCITLRIQKLESAQVLRMDKRRTNVQQLTCNIDFSCSFYFFVFSFVLLELKPFVLKGKVLGQKLWKSVKNCKEVWKIWNEFALSPQKIPSTPAEPRRTLEETPAEGPENSMRGKLPRKASRRVVPLGWWPSGTSKVNVFVLNLNSSVVSAK